MTIKHIFSDMDGALLDNHGGLSDGNLWTIKSSSLPTTLVSARSPGEMQSCVERLELKSHQIAFNGNLIFSQNEFGFNVIEEHTLNDETAQSILKLVSNKFQSVSLSWYTLTHWYILKQDKGVFIEKSLTGVEPTLGMIEKGKGIYKIMMIVFEPELMMTLKQCLLDLNISSITIVQSGVHYLEITSSKMNKPMAVQKILDQEGIDFLEIAAIGDGDNDVPLLKKAGLPIVTENANQNVKNYAKMIVRKNTEDGVAQAITLIESLNNKEP